MLPWYLYSLTPRDQSQPVMRVWNQAATVAAAAVTLETTWVVPAEQIAIISSWGIDARGGAGQSPQLSELSITPSGGVIDCRLPMSLYPDANNIAEQSMYTFLLAPPGATIRIGCSFNLGGVANAIFTGLAAMLIPRGTMQIV